MRAPPGHAARLTGLMALGLLGAALISTRAALAGDYSFSATFNGTLLGLYNGTYYDGSGYGLAPNSCPPSACVFGPGLPMPITVNSLETTNPDPNVQGLLDITQTTSVFSQLGSMTNTNKFTTSNVGFIPNVGSWVVSVGPISSGIGGGADVNAVTTPFIPLAGTSGSLQLANGTATLQKTVGATLPNFPTIAIPNTIVTGPLTGGSVNYSTGPIQPPTVLTLMFMTLAQYAAGSPIIPSQTNPDKTSETWSSVPSLSQPDGANNFAATVYQTADKSQTVIAMKGGNTGTDTAALYTYAAALSTFSSNPGSVVTSQADQLADLVKLVELTNPGTKITLTSYSVGGLPVQIVANTAGVQAVTFDSQGAANMLSAFASDPHLAGLSGTPSPSSQIYNYRLQGDQVSLWSPQVGLQVTVTPDPSLPSAGLLSILGQHAIEPLAGQILAAGPAFPGILSSNLYTAGVGSETSQLSNILFGTNVAGSPASVSFQQTVTNGLQYLFDPPPGWSYSLTETLDSPRFTSVSLPLQDNIAGWGLTYFTDLGTFGTTISDTGIFDLGSDVDRLDFFALDSLNNQIMVDNPFVFGLTFDSDGPFNGNVAVTPSPSNPGTSVPEPSSLVLLAAALVGLGVIRPWRLNA